MIPLVPPMLTTSLALLVDVMGKSAIRDEFGLDSDTDSAPKPLELPPAVMAKLKEALDDLDGAVGSNNREFAFTALRALWYVLGQLSCYGLGWNPDKPIGWVAGPLASLLDRVRVSSAAAMDLLTGGRLSTATAASTEYGVAPALALAIAAGAGEAGATAGAAAISAAVGFAGGLTGYLTWRFTGRDLGQKDPITWPILLAAATASEASLAASLSKVGLTIGRNCLWILTPTGFLTRLVQRMKDRARSSGLKPDEILLVEREFEAAAANAVDRFRGLGSKHLIAARLPGIAAVLEITQLLIFFSDALGVIFTGGRWGRDMALNIAMTLQEETRKLLLEDAPGCWNSVRRSWPATIAKAVAFFIGTLGKFWFFLIGRGGGILGRSGQLVSIATLTSWLLSWLRSEYGPLSEDVLGHSFDWLFVIAEEQKLPPDMDRAPSFELSQTVRIVAPPNATIRLVRDDFPMESTIDPSVSSTLPGGGYWVSVSENGGPWRKATPMLPLPLAIPDEGSLESITHQFECTGNICTVTALGSEIGTFKRSWFLHLAEPIARSEQVDRNSQPLDNQPPIDDSNQPFDDSNQPVYLVDDAEFQSDNRSLKLLSSDERIIESGPIQSGDYQILWAPEGKEPKVIGGTKRIRAGERLVAKIIVEDGRITGANLSIVAKY